MPGFCERAASILFLGVACALASGDTTNTDDRIRFSHDKDVIRVEVDGKLFTAYHYAGADRPYFYPLIGPTGENLTRHWPMKEVDGEERDHPHHRSLWFTHGDVNGHDFWTEGKGTRIVQKGSAALDCFADHGTLRTRSDWVARDGTVVCSDERTHTFYATNHCAMMDLQFTIIASHGRLVLGDSKEGTMAFRVAPALSLKGKGAAGHIVNSEGRRDGEAWGKRAQWCDYSGPMKSGAVGIALFDHPGNPRHPTWWHARDYGLCAANPFGISYFEGTSGKAGNMTIENGQSVTFRYGVYLHRGDAKAGKVAEKYGEYAVR